MKKILIIRFSSIGDIIQCMAVTRGIKDTWPGAQLSWITRTDMAPMLKADPYIDKIYLFDRKLGLTGLVKMAVSMRQANFDIVYDAHNNIRSFVVRTILLWRKPSMRPQLTIRGKQRFKRFLFFNLYIRSALKLPFRGIRSFMTPLRRVGCSFTKGWYHPWEFPQTVIDKIEGLLPYDFFHTNNYITLVPSAAWELKRWPMEYWQQLILKFPDRKFVIIGGPEDTFTNEIAAIAPQRVLNMAGKTNLFESFYLIYCSSLVVSNDTGFLHAADIFGNDGIALMGPTAFGHPTGSTIKVMETDLYCRPCSKEGNKQCAHSQNKKCLTDITPEMVVRQIINFREQ